MFVLETFRYEIYLEHNGKQYFNPLYVHNLGLSAHERRQFQETEHPSCVAHAFVPRQKFFIAIFKQKQVQRFTFMNLKCYHLLVRYVMKCIIMLPH